jgi:hypothetical protein
MKAGTLPLFVWAGFLAVLWFVHLLFRPALLSGSLLGIASLSTAAIAVGVLVARRFAGERDVLDVPDLSVGTAVVGAGIATVAVSGEVGYWLTLVGAALVLIGATGVVRESRVGRGGSQR